MTFIWLTEGVTFRTPREVLRFLYCHEWMHWYLREELGQEVRGRDGVRPIRPAELPATDRHDR